MRRFALPGSLLLAFAGAVSAEIRHVSGYVIWLSGVRPGPVSDTQAAPLPWRERGCPPSKAGPTQPRLLRSAPQIAAHGSARVFAAVNAPALQFGHDHAAEFLEHQWRDVALENKAVAGSGVEHAL